MSEAPSNAAGLLPRLYSVPRGEKQASASTHAAGPGTRNIHGQPVRADFSGAPPSGSLPWNSTFWLEFRSTG
jgi:hypothetical protein